MSPPLERDSRDHGHRVGGDGQGNCAFSCTGMRERIDDPRRIGNTVRERAMQRVEVKVSCAGAREVEEVGNGVRISETVVG